MHLPSRWRGYDAWEKLLFGGMSVSFRDLCSGDGWRVSDVVCRAGPARSAVRGAARRHLHRRRHRGHVPLPRHPGNRDAGAGRHTARQCQHLLRMQSRARRRRPLRLVPLHAEAHGERACRCAGREAAGLWQDPPAAILRLARLVADAEAARETGEAAELEEIALGLAGATATALAGARQAKAPTRMEERRIAEAVRCIEASAETAISLGDLAKQAGLSPFHFLRTFRRVAGMTPYQFLLQDAAAPGGGARSGCRTSRSRRSHSRPASTISRRSTGASGVSWARRRGATVRQSAAGSPGRCVPSDDDFTTAFALVSGRAATYRPDRSVSH